MRKTEKKSITRIIVVLALIAIVMVISITTQKKSLSGESLKANDTIYLFNGNDLNNWKVLLKDSLAPPDSTFFIRDGLLAVTGEPFGYIRTKDVYSDYDLSVEWRWVEGPGNSGVFLHIQNDSIWPVCLECQLKSQKAGDFVCFPGFDFKEYPENAESKTVEKMKASSEYETGQWNNYDIRVRGDSIRVFVNGVLQNIATGTNFTEGKIALQSEGKPIEFRNVYLIEK